MTSFLVVGQLCILSHTKRADGSWIKGFHLGALHLGEAGSVSVNDFHRQYADTPDASIARTAGAQTWRNPDLHLLGCCSHKASSRTIGVRVVYHTDHIGKQHVHEKGLEQFREPRTCETVCLMSICPPTVRERGFKKLCGHTRTDELVAKGWITPFW